MATELGPHQLDALRNLDNGKILKGGVGSGKSRTALAYFILKECKGSAKINGRTFGVDLSEPKDLYIITTAKKRNSLDWEHEASDFGLSTDPRSSYGGIRVVVDSWNNISRYSGIQEAFFIFDEQRVVGTGVWAKEFIKIAKQNRWILLSATPGDNWLDYAPVFIANGWYKNITEFKRRHVVYNSHATFPKVDHYVEQDRLEKLRHHILIDMPYERHTTRHVENILVTYDKQRYDYLVTKRWHIYENRPVRDIGELFILMRKLVNTDPDRMGAVMKLFEKHKKVIIFYNFDYELEVLRTLCNTINAVYAEYNGHKHQEIPKSDKWLYLVQYTAGAEGWNCIETNAVIFWSLNYSYKIMEQSKGRIDRLNTPFTDLYYYILRSASSIDTAITRSLAGKHNFNERDYFKRSKEFHYDQHTKENSHD